MNKQLGSIMLIAGTCIGSGMIALPLMMAKLGIIASTLLMFIMWMVIYFTALASVELNLQAGRGMTLGELGRKLSGPIAEIIGYLSVKLLSLCLLAAYIYAGSSILQTLIGKETSFKLIATIYASIVFVILLFPIKIVDYINRVMFVILLSLVLLLIIGLLTKVDHSNLPLIEKTTSDSSSWRMLVPVAFTSFGFHVIFHTLTNYCEKNEIMLKRAFFWGSLIPTIVYILWTASTMAVVSANNSDFYLQMITGQVQAGQLIEQLSIISSMQFVQLCIWWISLLAILTSVIGVGIGLFSSYCQITSKLCNNSLLTRIISSFAVVIIPYSLAVLIPNAFIAALGFAGLILVVIAIFQPIYLLHKAKIKHYHYPILKNKCFILLSSIAGLLIIVCELINIFA